MRFLAIGAIVAACLGASATLYGGEAITGPDLYGMATAAKQTGAKPPRTGGDDSCQWANDNECDEPDIGTGACTAATDYSDCRRIRAGIEDNSCRWANDGECDEPRFGTGACVQGTDRNDCGDIAWMRNQNDSCATSFNGVCEEPGRGNGQCAARTDRSDCLSRERPMRINDHFFGRDDRVRVNAQEAPWRFMGRFVNAAGEACTATLIAPDIIATAAHCIHSGNGVSDGGTFEPAAGGDSATAVAYLLDRRFNYARFTAGDDIDGLDWALVRLDRRLGDRLGFAGVRNLAGEGAAAARAADLYQAGYSWDTGETLSGNVGCHIIETHRDNTFAHECDTTRGDSGSGFLVRDGDRFDLIGVDSNFRSNPNGPFIYIAVGAGAFQSRLADFVAGRTGAPFRGAAAGKPKRALN
ncbi:MAG: trypsin-like serine protease [Hyphomonadaceae bacterium]|nr:trypsin-like serine protease [Hyphomonadaceae bacterium]